MGGVVSDAGMQTEFSGLFAAGEAVGGANGANRLSGNAISEALVFGERAGRCAVVANPESSWRESAAVEAVDRIRGLAGGRKGDGSAATLLDELRTLMSDRQ